MLTTLPRYATILTCRRILMFLSVSWILVLASSVPPLLGVCPLAAEYRRAEAACGPTWTRSRVYPAIHVATGVLVPISLMIGWNAHIVQIAK